MAELDLSYTMTRTGEYLVLVLVGELDLATASRVRAGLRKAEAEQPAAIVVDLTGVRVRGELPLLALAPPAERSECWYPPVVVCCPDEVVRQALGGSPVTAALPVRATREGALVEARQVDGAGTRVSRHIAATPAAPAAGREFLGDTCRAWQMTDVLPAAEVIVSELCANVVVHAAGSGPMTLVLARTPRSLHLVVRDGDATPPRLTTPEPDIAAVSGRGLYLVARLAAAWGYRLTATGKAVWAVLRRPGAEGSPVAQQSGHQPGQPHRAGE